MGVCMFICLPFLFYLACNVNGAVGDGTVRGTCNAGELCNRDGRCHSSTYTNHIYIIFYVSYIYIYINFCQFETRNII